MRLMMAATALVASFLSTGCAFNMLDSRPYSDNPDPHTIDGKLFCSELESKASSWSGGDAAGGWIFAGLAASSATAGTIVTTANAAADGGGNKAVGIAGAAMIAGSALLVPAALAFFSRADAATALGAEANHAMLEETDKKAYERCVAAKAAWIGSRADANAMGREVAQKAQSDKKNTEAKASKQKAEAEQKAAAAEEESKGVVIAAEAKTEEANKKVKDADKKLQQIKDKLLPKKSSVPPEVWQILPPDPH